MARKQKPPKSEISANEVVGFFSGIAHKFVVGLLSDDREEPWHQHIRRLLMGGAGGLFYIAVKNYLAEGSGIVNVIMMQPGARRTELLVGYWVAPAMCAAIGAVAAWLSQIRSNRLLFAMGMVGVLIFQNLFALNSQKVSQLWNWNPVSVAYAQNDQQCIGDSAFTKGFKAFFGVQDQYDKYAVVIASGKSQSDADSKLKRLKSAYPALDLRVGARACDNNFYPVYASDFLPLNDAKKILAQVKKLNPSTEDAYLSPGPRGAEDN